MKTRKARQYLARPRFMKSALLWAVKILQGGVLYFPASLRRIEFVDRALQTPGRPQVHLPDREKYQHDEEVERPYADPPYRTRKRHHVRDRQHHIPGNHRS